MTERKQISRKLESELERLKSVLNFGQELKLEWTPGRVRHFDGRRLSGEVLGEVIHIYEESEQKALRTLKHEFIEYVLANEFTEPYRQLVNTLVMAFEKEARRRKEKLVERLSDVI